MQIPENEYNPFYKGYVDRVPDKGVHQLLDEQKQEFAQLIRGIDPGQADYRYAPGKWTIKQLIQHVIDSERVFAYRMMSFSRGEKTSLPGFDENEYAAGAPVSHRSLADLASEFEVVRSATSLLAGSLIPEQWVMMGNANGSDISVRALAHIIVGHCMHHMAILRERYAV